MKKILLIQSTPYYNRTSLIKKNRLYFVGLALPLIAALTPPPWEVEIVLETIEDIPFDTEAELIGISGMGHAIIRSIDIAKEFKKRGKTVVMGGYMASLMLEETKKHCDSVVIGDIEHVWEKVLSDYENGELQSFYQSELKNLSYPIPRYDLIVKKKIGNFLPVQAGRGCPNTCSFCSVYCLYHQRYYKREINEVIRDIKYIKSLGFKRFLLLDDNVYSDKAYLKELCLEIKKCRIKWFSQCSVAVSEDKEILELMSSSGCEALSFGLESISQESLNTLNKKWAKVSRYSEQLREIRNTRIDVSTEMVVGADGDSIESISATAKFIEDNKITIPRFYILTPIPGTKFFDEMKQQNRIIEDDIYSYNGARAVHQPLNMSPEELTDAYWKLYKDVFSFRSILLRTVIRKEFFKTPFRYIFYLYINLFYRYQINKGITPNII